MTDLFMGEVDRKNNPQHTLKAGDMKHHMFVTGQSGCGKSSLAGRLVEEIILRDVGHVLVLDCNFEFSRFSEVDVNSFKQDHNRKNCPEDQPDAFSKAWEPKVKAKKIQAIKAKEINIPYQDIETYLKAPLLGIDREKHPGTYWLLQLIDEHNALKKRITSKDSLKRLLPDIARWFEGRVKQVEAEAYGTIVHELRRNMSALDLTRFVNAAKSLGNQKYVNSKAPKGKTTVNDKLVGDLFDSIFFCSIDLLDFEYAHYHIRDFVVLHLLHSIWREARIRFIKRKAINGAASPPLFIVIDEAHNLAPSKVNWTQSPTAQEVARIIRTIAAEGRKFGLFLILVSQRPEKVDESVLSECDNFIVMKSTLPTIRKLAQYLGVPDTELEKAASFNKGQAYYCGAFTSDRALVKVEGDIKRTR